MAEPKRESEGENGECEGAHDGVPPMVGLQSGKIRLNLTFANSSRSHYGRGRSCSPASARRTMMGSARRDAGSVTAHPSCDRRYRLTSARFRTMLDDEHKSSRSLQR